MLVLLNSPGQLWVLCCIPSCMCWWARSAEEQGECYSLLDSGLCHPLPQLLTLRGLLLKAGP